ncbi:type II toxin-antitoxin system RelE/ParE family toxin [Rubripirellula obstinata]|nr:type II toxin-antitoxin system RelE/ParE family toxin [Rubripirellula obstinata]
MSAELHPDAIAELDLSADWYAERSPTASRNFLVAVDVAIATIVSDPNRFAYIDDRHQSCAVRKFPFQVVFRQAAGRILVIAIAHAKRRPGYWMSR